MTYAGFKVRVLQAFFEGNRLHVIKSDIISFEKKKNRKKNNGKKNNVEGLKCLISWICCEAKGSTLWEHVPKDPYGS